MRLTFILYYQWGSAPPFDWMEWWFPIGEIDETLSFELYLHFMSSHHHHHFPTIYHHRQSVTNGSTWSENGAEQFLFILFKILHSVFKVNRNTWMMTNIHFFSLTKHACGLCAKEWNGKYFPNVYFSIKLITNLIFTWKLSFLYSWIHTHGSFASSFSAYVVGCLRPSTYPQAVHT